jgi:hypothetical protein
MGWLLISIILPLVAPICALLFLRPLPLPPELAPLRDLVVPIKDGQLCWVAIGFCASALYEMAVTSFCGTHVLRAYGGMVTGGLVTVLAGSSIVAAGGAIFPTATVRRPSTTWMHHYSCLIVSLALALCAAALYALVHFDLLINHTVREMPCLPVG